MSLTTEKSTFSQHGFFIFYFFYYWQVSELQRKILQLIGGFKFDPYFIQNLHLAADGTQTPKLDFILRSTQKTEEMLLLQCSNEYYEFLLGE